MHSDELGHSQPRPPCKLLGMGGLLFQWVPLSAALSPRKLSHTDPELVPVKMHPGIPKTHLFPSLGLPCRDGAWLGSFLVPLALH